MKKVLGAITAIFVIAVLVVFIGLRTGRLGPPKVPKDVIASAVNRTPALMDKAWALPSAKLYAQPLHWQVNGSICGPASLVNVLASLQLPVHEESEVLSGSGKCWTGFCFMGLTLDELAEVARARGKQVTVLRELSADAFLSELKKANDPSVRYTVNFDRKAIFNAGGGHHSPIGGYLEQEDLVLVLDVNQDFGPWLVERERLFKAISGVDSSSGKTRGLLRIQ